MNVSSVIMSFLLSTFALPGASLLAQTPGTSFQHHDWELVCDNTGTCRAAGYQAGEDQPAVSLLLVRNAGPRQEITARIQLGSASDRDIALRERITTLAIKVNGRSIGRVDVDPVAQSSPLSSAAVAAIVPALLQSSVVSWSHGERTWTLSTSGASAVLLKMDDFQRRTGTVGAIARKGSKSEDSVLKPVAAPLVTAAFDPKSGKQALLRPAWRTVLLSDLRKLASIDDCPRLHDTFEKDEEPALSLHGLSGNKLVAFVVCELFAYNQSSMFWVVNATPPFHAVQSFAPVVAGIMATSYANGTISLAEKGRSLGDCWNGEKWTWDGTRFVRTSEFTTGMCKRVAARGAWNLPTYVTTVSPRAIKAH
jgi:hypothetical protein